MTRNGAATQRPLVSSRRDHDGTATGGVVECLLELVASHRRRLRQRHAQVDHPGTSVSDSNDSLGKFRGVCNELLAVTPPRFREDRANHKCAVRANARGWRASVGGQYSGDKRAMQTRGTVDRGAGGRRYLPNPRYSSAREVLVREEDWSVDNADNHVLTAGGEFHKRPQANDVDRVGRGSLFMTVIVATAHSRKFHTETDATNGLSITGEGAALHTLSIPGFGLVATYIGVTPCRSHMRSVVHSWESRPLVAAHMATIVGPKTARARDQSASINRQRR